MNNKLHRKFCNSVRDFVKEYAELASLKNCVESGEVLEDTHYERLNHLLSSISDKMGEIEELETELGYTSVGIPLQDANFEGFSIVNGEIQGTTVSNAYLIAENWICDFWDAKRTSESDCFKFFVGIFLYYMAELADPAVMDELYGTKEKESENYASERGKKRSEKDQGILFHLSNWFRRHWNFSS